MEIDGLGTSGVPSRCFQVTSSEPYLCPSWKDRHPPPDSCSLSAHALCKRRKQTLLTEYGVEQGLYCLPAGPSPAQVCLAFSDHPTTSPRERLVHELDTTGELLVDLGSDQTSCHNPFNGGYYPVQLSFSEAQSLMSSNPAAFKHLVQERWAAGKSSRACRVPNLSEPQLPSFRGDHGHSIYGNDGTN